MKKEVPIHDYLDELLKRIEDAKTIDCCKEENKVFAAKAKKLIGDETIEIDWKN